MARLRSAGLTLIEIVIVLTIMGLIAAIAVPQIDITGYRVRSGMSSIAATLSTARRIAVTRQHDVVVKLDQGTSAILVHDDANNNGAVDGGERQRRVPLGDAVVFGLGGATAHSIGNNAINVVKLQGGFPAVIFRRNGSASESASFYLTSQRAAGTPGYSDDTRLLEIERGTGRVSWYRYSGSSWLRGF